MTPAAYHRQPAPREVTDASEKHKTPRGTGSPYVDLLSDRDRVFRRVGVKARVLDSLNGWVQIDHYAHPRHHRVPEEDSERDHQEDASHAGARLHEPALALEGEDEIREDGEQNDEEDRVRHPVVVRGRLG